MNLFVTSDHHLDHRNIARFTNRPIIQDGDLDETNQWVSDKIASQRLVEMNDMLRTRWNDVVRPKDLVYIVGDFAWNNHGKWINILNGKKILIRGNHDKMNQSMLNQFTEVHDLLFRKIDGTEVMFCHYAMKTWRNSIHGSWHLYGHSHGKMAEHPDIPACDVGVDVWNYRPIPWEVLRTKLEHRKRKKFGKADFEKLDANVETLRQENLALLE